MRARWSTANCPTASTGKDIILAIIGEIGTAGGTGYVLEYAGDAIRALSMEGRMTVCNMSIEGGARAGLIAPRRKGLRVFEGPPEIAEGRALGTPRCVTGTRCVPIPARISTTKFALDAAKAAADRDLGHVARGRGLDRGCGGRTPTRSPTKPSGSQSIARLKYMGLTAGTKITDIKLDRVFHRLLHQRPHRGSARGGEGRRGQDRQRSCQCDDRAGLWHREGAGGSRRPRQDLHQGRLRMARAGLLDVPRHEPPTSCRRKSAAPRPRTAIFEGRQGFKGPHPPGPSPAMAAAAAICRAFCRYQGLALIVASISRRSGNVALRRGGQTGSLRE